MRPNLSPHRALPWGSRHCGPIPARHTCTPRSPGLGQGAWLSPLKQGASVREGKARPLPACPLGRPRSAGGSSAPPRLRSGSFARNVSFHHCSVSHFAAAERGPGAGWGASFGTYFSFSLTTGGLTFSGAEGAAGGRRACLYRGRCLGARADAPRLLIAASAPCPSMVRSTMAVGLAATCSQPCGPGNMARGLPCDLRETVGLLWTQSGTVTPMPQPPKSNKTHTGGGVPSTCWTLTAADGPSSPRKGKATQRGGMCAPRAGAQSGCIRTQDRLTHLAAGCGVRPKIRLHPTCQ